LKQLLYRLARKLSWHAVAQKIKRAILLDNMSAAFRVTTAAQFYNLQNEGLNFYLRKQGSDLQVAHQIFFLKEYLPVLNFMISKGFKVDTFLDLGANIGLTSLFVHNLFPEIKIAAVEPDEGNYQMLLRNFKQAKLVHPITFNRAIWSEETILKLSRNFADGQDWAINVVTEDSSSQDEVETITMQSLLTTLGWEHIDLLKVDIEGAEGVLFDADLNDLGFLQRVSVVAMELHEGLVNSKKIIDLLSQNGFNYFLTGELHVFYRC
jgi:FkbM family methyltransferase